MPRVDPKNSSRYWLHPRTLGLSLLSPDFTTHEYPTHIHEALLVAVTEAGGSEIKAYAGPDEAHSATLLVVNPTEPHSSRMNAELGKKLARDLIELPGGHIGFVTQPAEFARQVVQGLERAGHGPRA